jgi:DNA primase
MALIPQSFIADLLNRVDIVDVVGQQVKLKKAGANYQGLCPFHSEKSPSFSVSPTKQFYHCFGCGAHGSAISFLMEYSGLGYVDAIEDLARSAGLDVPREERTANDVARQQQTMALSEVMSAAADWYRQQLKIAPRAVEYLKGRGLTGEIAKRYALGYAPDGWQGLEAVFGTYANDEVAKTLLDGGLLIQSEPSSDNQTANQTTRRYDRFRDRIMFPIRNPKGQTIGFGGRILDQGEPKYLNSPETPLFSKGNTLYGLFEARQAIRSQEYVLVCEGYMDVVALAQLGFPNAVATLGTACTANHVRMLLRQADRVVFSFDGDAAGQRAAQRALEACLPLMSDDKEIRFLFLPTEHDPDSYVRAYGAPAFEKVIKEAMSISSFFFKIVSQEHELTTPEGRAQTHHAAKPLLLSMPPIALRTQILREVAIRTNSTPAELESFCGLTIAPAPVQQGSYAPNFVQTSSGNRAQGAPWQASKGSAKRVATQNIAPPQAPTDLAEQMLRVLIQFPHLGKALDPNKRALALQASELRSAKALELMKDLLAQCDLVELIPGENGKPPAVGAGAFALFQEQLSRSELAPLYEVLRKRVMGSDLEIEGAIADLDGAFKKLELTHLKTEMTEIAQKIAGSTATEQDRARYRELGERLKFS